MRALFLGLGGVGQRHLRNLRMLMPKAQLAAVRHSGRTFEITPQLTIDVSVDIVQKYSISIYKTIAEAINQFKPDLAVVATPSSLHAAQASMLAEAQVPVLLEKPLAHCETAMETLIKAQHDNAVLIMIGYILRFHPGVQKLKDLMLGEVIGRLYSGHIVANTYMPDWHNYESPSEYYVGQKALGGGTILTNIHLIDLLAWILGKPARLWCRGGRVSDMDIDVEDAVSALFDYEIDGHPAPVTMNMSFVQAPPANTMTFRGSLGEITWDLGQGQIVKSHTNGVREPVNVEPIEWNDLFVRELEHFLDALNAPNPSGPTLQNSIDGQRMAFAMKTSLEHGDIQCLSE